MKSNVYLDCLWLQLLNIIKGYDYRKGTNVSTLVSKGKLYYAYLKLDVCVSIAKQYLDKRHQYLLIYCANVCIVK